MNIPGTVLGRYICEGSMYLKLFLVVLIGFGLILAATNLIILAINRAPIKDVWKYLLEAAVFVIACVAVVGLSRYLANLCQPITNSESIAVLLALGLDAVVDAIIVSLWNRKE